MKFNHPSGHKDTEEDYFSGEASEADQAEDSDNEGDQAEEAEEVDENKKGKRTDKIRTVVRKPQPKLDPTRLCGPRGLKCLMENFDKFKPKGDGHEFKDLDTLMAKYEYWAHRLFPKMKFTDVIERLEKLGDKREVKSQLYNIRLGQGQLTDQNEEDQNLGDEEITTRVMNMMQNLEDSDEDSHRMTVNRIDDDEDDEDNELISQLLSTNQI